MTNTRNPNRIDRARLRAGMQVQSGEGQTLGAIEALDADSITVKGQQYELSSIERIEGDRVYLTRQVGASTDRGRAAAGTAMPTGTARDQVVEAEGQVRVPVREERLEVEKRPAELGAVEVRKTVTSEQQTVPVELTREEVHVEQRDVADRPATEADLSGAFEEGTIRVPVRGEEAVARKEAVVTGEVVIDKTRTTETQRITDTIRKERVEVDEGYERQRAAYERAYAGRRPQAGDLAYAEAEPHYRFGYGAGLEARKAGRSWEEAEADLRARYRDAGADDDAWAQIKRAVREGFDHARGR
jgi:uncharacterized protein (TIGR02271 family)